MCLKHDHMLFRGCYIFLFPVIEHRSVAAKTQECPDTFQHLNRQRNACEAVIVIEMGESSPHIAHGTECSPVGFKGTIGPEVSLQVVSAQRMGTGLTESSKAFTSTLMDCALQYHGVLQTHGSVFVQPVLDGSAQAQIAFPG